jgi:hypothetical protein
MTQPIFPSLFHEWIDSGKLEVTQDGKMYQLVSPEKTVVEQTKKRLNELADAGTISIFYQSKIWENTRGQYEFSVSLQ